MSDLIDFFIDMKPMYWIFIGGLIGAIGTTLTIYATLKHNEASALKTAAMKETGEDTNTKVANLMTENEQLKNNLKDIGEENRRLHKKLEDTQDRAMKYMDGHDSYCIVEIIPTNNNKADVFLTHVGQYPLYGITLKIFNTTDADNGKKVYRSKPTQVDFEEGSDHDYREHDQFEVNELHFHSRKKVKTIDCPKETINSFMITVTARNGVWYERFKIWPYFPRGNKQNQIYSVLKIDPDNPKSSPKHPKTLAVIESTPIPDHVTIHKDTYDWFGHNWF